VSPAKRNAQAHLLPIFDLLFVEEGERPDVPRMVQIGEATADALERLLPTLYETIISRRLLRQLNEGMASCPRRLLCGIILCDYKEYIVTEKENE